MKSIGISIIIFITAHLNPAAPTTVDCEFKRQQTFSLGSIHTCVVQDEVNIILPEDREIDKIYDMDLEEDAGSGNFHQVLGFYSENNEIIYFPRGLEKLFKNIKMVFIEFGRLKEIKQADLRCLTKLEELSLGNNDIEVLDDGLFDFNPKLKFVSFNQSPIIQIGQNVFSNMLNLRNLWLQETKCIDLKIIDDTKMVKRSLNIVRRKCGKVDNSECKCSTKPVNYGEGVIQPRLGSDDNDEE